MMANVYIRTLNGRIIIARTLDTYFPGVLIKYTNLFWISKKIIINLITLQNEWKISEA